MRVCFSIDNAHDPRTLARFLRHMDNQRAMGKLHGPFQLCIGSYEGELKYSFICDADDWSDYAEKWSKNQESILFIYKDLRVVESREVDSKLIGIWTKVTEAEAKSFVCKTNDESGSPDVASRCWTYILEEKSWWIIR